MFSAHPLDTANDISDAGQNWDRAESDTKHSTVT